MSVNSSSSLDHILSNCCESRMTILIFTCMLIINNLILLPPLFFIFYLGLQRWRQNRSSSTPAVMTHSDFFTYNIAAMDLISILGSCLYCFGAYNAGEQLQWVGYSIFFLTIPGQTLFHLLTCVERYLAVVHPITYLSLRRTGGVRIRNVTTACVWLLCFGFMGLTQPLSNVLITITYFGIMGVFLVVICFCTFSILHVLNHPGPREISGDRERVDQLKQRAFHTIVSILVALLFRLFGVTICWMMFSWLPLTHTKCAVGSSAMWLDMPGSLVLPLLYLQRAGKLPACRHKTQDNF